MSKAALIDYDLVIRGGGPLACAIARDAAGRGLSVMLVSEHDLGGAVTQHIISFGLTHINDQDAAQMTWDYPQVDLAVNESPETKSALTWLFKKRQDPQSITFCGATINRFALLNMRDAVERGARFVADSDVSYSRLGDDHWQVNISPVFGKKQEAVTARIIIDTSPAPNHALQARTALFERPRAFVPATQVDGAKTTFALQSGSESIVLGIISEAAPTELYRFRCFETQTASA